MDKLEYYNIFGQILYVDISVVDIVGLNIGTFRKIFRLHNDIFDK